MVREGDLLATNLNELERLNGEYDRLFVRHVSAKQSNRHLQNSTQFPSSSHSPPMLPSLPVFSHVVSAPFKRAQLGLFHGKMKQFGNSVPFSKHKTRRTWLPNIQSKWLFSDALAKGVQVKLSTKALKTIKKVIYVARRPRASFC